jgi:hypothetical protein
MRKTPSAPQAAMSAETGSVTASVGTPRRTSSATFARPMTAVPEVQA